MTDPTDKFPQRTADRTDAPGQSDDLATTRRLFMGVVSASTVVGSTATIVGANDGESTGLIGYGEGTYGDGGFGGVAVEPELALSIDGPAETEVSQAEVYELQLTNDGDETPENVRIGVELTNDGKIEPSDVTIEYRDGDGEWRELELTKNDDLLTGVFGPDDGFPVPEGYDETTDVRATFEVADVYTAAVTAVGVGEDKAEYATASETISVALPPVEETRVDLLAGQRLDVGEVTVSTDPAAGTLKVTYETTDNWSINETHLAVGRDLDEFDDEGWVNPRGMPRPGHFPYSGRHGSNDSVTYEHELTTSPGRAEPGETVLIAAHADVEGDDGREGAWADGDRFVQRGNWATYFEYNVKG